MLGAHIFWHLTEATFGIIIVALIGSIGVWQGKRGRRVEAKMDQALAGADTGNEKDIGETIHDMAQTQEVISGQMHANTRKLAALGDQHTQLTGRLEAHIVESKKVHEEVLARISEEGASR